MRSGNRDLALILQKNPSIGIFLYKCQIDNIAAMAFDKIFIQLFFQIFQLSVKSHHILLGVKIDFSIHHFTIKNVTKTDRAAPVRGMNKQVFFVLGVVTL